MLATQLVRVTASLANPQTQVLSITTGYIKFACNKFHSEIHSTEVYYLTVTGEEEGRPLPGKGDVHRMEGVSEDKLHDEFLFICACWEQNVTTCVWMW